MLTTLLTILSRTLLLIAVPVIVSLFLVTIPLMPLYFIFTGRNLGEEWLSVLDWVVGQIAERTAAKG